HRSRSRSYCGDSLLRFSLTRQGQTHREDGRFCWRFGVWEASEAGEEDGERLSDGYSWRRNGKQAFDGQSRDRLRT
ncbi:MAG: hypothetical protein AAB403_19455, partial [Planctomycetota bacterium]